MLLRRKYFILSSALLLVILANFLPLIEARIDGSTSSNNERLRLMNVAVTMIESRPLFGHGPKSFHNFDAIQKNVANGTSDAHNAFLGLAAELGLLAFFVFITSLTYVAIKSMKIKNFRRFPIALFSVYCSMGLVTGLAFSDKYLILVLLLPFLMAGNTNIRQLSNLKPI